jgi:hypothetical protein
VVLARYFEKAQYQPKIYADLADFFGRWLIFWLLQQKHSSVVVVTVIFVAMLDQWPGINRFHHGLAGLDWVLAFPFLDLSTGACDDVWTNATYGVTYNVRRHDRDWLRRILRQGIWPEQTQYAFSKCATDFIFSAVSEDLAFGRDSCDSHSGIYCLALHPRRKSGVSLAHDRLRRGV